MRLALFFLCIVYSSFSFAQKKPVKLGLLKYNGGGDWYANPTALPNLSRFCNEKLRTNIDPDYATIDVGSAEIFDYAWIHMTGHGNVVFCKSEAENLRRYLLSGGFLHIDDNYGMDPFVRVAMKSVFPELDFIELPFNHPIYKSAFEFKQGLPKIHKHDNKPAQGFGLFWENRLICYYSYETDLGDGWENQDVHNDPEEKRIDALRMGANLVKFAFEN